MYNFYCVVKADTDDVLPGGKAVFRSPIDLTQGQYEVALCYVSFIPKWDVLDDLFMVYYDDKGTRETILFDNMFCANSEAVIEDMSNELADKYGTDFRKNQSYS